MLDKDLYRVHEHGVDRAPLLPMYYIRPTLACGGTHKYIMHDQLNNRSCTKSHVYTLYSNKQYLTNHPNSLIHTDKEGCVLINPTNPQVSVLR